MRALGLAVSALLLSSCRTETRGGPAAPNILFILADDLGWKDLRCQGNEAFHTPHLDRLAAQGMRFTQAYAASPVCSPTRAAAMTGLAPARLKVTNHNPDRWSFYQGSELGPGKSTTHLDLRYETAAEILKRHGYATGFFGKWHLSHGEWGKVDPRQLPDRRGFDLNVAGNSWGGPGGKGSFFDPYQIPNLPSRTPGEFLDDRLADEAAAFMKDRSAAGVPFFACLWTYAVHWPIEAPADLLAKHGADDRPRYRAMVEALDRAVGRVLRAVDDLGDTLVVFTSDNGPLLDYTSAEPLKNMKGHLDEGGLRVPFLVRRPGHVAAGAVCDVPIVTTDLVPTFLEAAGIPFAAGRYDGESLGPLLRQEGGLTRDALFFHYPHKAYHRRNRMGSAIRQGDLKLLKWYDVPGLELYDLKSDPGERVDLSRERPEVARALAERLDRWLAETGAELPRPFAAIPDGELAGKRPD